MQYLKFAYFKEIQRRTFMFVFEIEHCFHIHCMKIVFLGINVLCFKRLRDSYVEYKTNFNQICVMIRYCKPQFLDQAFLSIIFTLNMLLWACANNIVIVFVRLRCVTTFAIRGVSICIQGTYCADPSHNELD